MAFDTVIDKAQFESALTASANAIREKTGSTDSIEWFADKGFADAIGAIETGGGGEPSDMEAQWIAAIENEWGNFTTKLPDGVKTIGMYAFKGNSAMKLTHLPSSVTGIKVEAFSGCSELALTELPNGVTYIHDSAFANCVNITLAALPENLESIGSKAFIGCKLITIDTIPASVKIIDSAAFQSCKGMTSLTFKGTPTNLNSNAFYGCTNILTINVPWAEGEVANAPWGATNATINYNYVPEPEEPEEPEDPETPEDPADKYTWDAVLASIDAGTYATDYAIGDTVPLDLGSEGVINMQIAAFDADDLADGSGKAPITWISEHLIGSETMGSTSAKTGWEGCNVRSYLANNIKPLIPSNVSSKIASVSKTQQCWQKYNNIVNQTTVDDLWIPSYDEMNGDVYSELFPTDESRIKSLSGTNNRWWLRSQVTQTASQSSWDYVDIDGVVKCATSAMLANGICLCFCT